MKRQDAASGSWDAIDFRAWVDTLRAGESLVVLANGDPVECVGTTEGQVSCASCDGLNTALQPLIDNCNVLWLARGEVEILSTRP